MLKLLRSFISPIELNVQLDLTNSCNLRCAHCYHADHNNASALDTRQWLQVIKKVKKFSTQVRARPCFYICGGEPTLAEAFPQVLRKIRSDFPESDIVVLTNGTTLTRPLHEGGSALSLIRETKAQVQISLDGAGAFEHDSIRGTGNFEKAKNAVRLLTEHNIIVSLQCVLSKVTSPQIVSFFDLAASLKVQAMNFVRLVEEGIAEKYVSGFGRNENPHLSGESLMSAMSKILENSKRTGIATYTGGALWTLLDPALGGAGRLGFYDVIIDYQGNLKVSSRTPVKLGNVLESKSIESVLSSAPILKALRGGDIEGCKDCEYFQKFKCSGDRNIAYAASGSYLGPDVGCWEWINKENEEKRKKVAARINSVSRIRSWGGKKCNEEQDVIKP